MRPVTLTKPANLARLYNDLITAIPALAPVIGSDGDMHARVIVAADDKNLVLHVPDDFNDALLTPVLDAHDPTPDPEPEPEPSRDDRLLAAVDSAKAAVAKSKVFTSAQAAVLSAVFDGLGKAITGEVQ